MLTQQKMVIFLLKMSELPVTCVNVRCGSAESPDLTVAFSRKSVHNTLLRHIDPVEFVRRQGGQLRS